MFTLYCSLHIIHANCKGREAMSTWNILIVEDDPDINTLLLKIVTRAGHKAEQAFSGTEAQLRLEKSTPDLILLDLMIPGLSGEALLSYIRHDLRLTTPIIVISAKVQLANKVEALSAGADDYITKPFETEEVLARIQAVLRRAGAVAGEIGGGEEDAGRGNDDGDGNYKDAETYSFKQLNLDAKTRRVVLKGQEVALTNHEFDLLHTLIKAPDTVFSRERLYELVWKSGYYGEDNTINVHISNIRKKFAAIDPNGDYIKTVWGIGFKLV